MIDPNWCRENPSEAASQLDLLAEQNSQLVDWQQVKVAKAADQSLEGYRELAERLARVEEDRDEWKAQAGADAYIASLYREDAESRCAERERLEAERDALAAHVERLHAAIHEAVMMPVAVKNGSPEEEELQDLRDLIGGAISEKPTASLARMRDERAMEIQRAVMAARHTWAKEDVEALRKRDARMKAEGAADLALRLRYDYEGQVHQDRIADFADEAADEYRRQAEEMGDG